MVSVLMDSVNVFITGDSKQRKKMTITKCWIFANSINKQSHSHTTHYGLLPLYVTLQQKLLNNNMNISLKEVYSYLMINVVAKKFKSKKLSVCIYSY